MKTKICSHCKTEKSINKFHKDKSRKDGLSHCCKKCGYEKSKTYHQSHKEKTHKRKFQYDRSLDGIFVNVRYSAKKRNIEFNFSKEGFVTWYNKQEQVCHYCKRNLEEIKKDKILNLNSYRFSIDRKNNNRGYILDNIVLCCLNCNIVKGKFFTEQEMLKMGSTLKEIFNNR